MASERQLDLRGIKCPLNWAHARVVLDEMGQGQRLVLLLDDPRAVRDIPAAAEAAGYAPGDSEDVATDDDHPCWRMVIEV